ncbi:hypothetical protein ACFWFZ_18495 [Streptomyces sp. NPDC060232]|uniref:hypothetical protein n=1 Tax=Streptomyces sp. NPDC060232 TaxID=3347079 RepID=UPI003661D3B0
MGAAALCLALAFVTRVPAARTPAEPDRAAGPDLAAEPEPGRRPAQGPAYAGR